MLNYEEFKERVAAEITSYLSDKYEFADVSITEVVKNNGTVLDSLNTEQTFFCKSVQTDTLNVIL